MKKNSEEIKEEIKELISKNKAKDNKQAKKLAMRNNIKLGNLRKNFCKKCFKPLRGKTRINKEFKTIRCENCNTIHRWLIKTS